MVAYFCGIKGGRYQQPTTRRDLTVQKSTARSSYVHTVHTARVRLLQPRRYIRTNSHIHRGILDGEKRQVDWFSQSRFVLLISQGQATKRRDLQSQSSANTNRGRGLIGTRLVSLTTMGLHATYLQFIHRVIFEEAVVGAPCRGSIRLM